LFRDLRTEDEKNDMMINKDTQKECPQL